MNLTPTLTLTLTLPQEQRVPFVLPGPQLRVVARPDILAVTR
jgi:hypothetical protein